MRPAGAERRERCETPGRSTMRDSIGGDGDAGGDGDGDRTHWRRSTLAGSEVRKLKFLCVIRSQAAPGVSVLCVL